MIRLFYSTFPSKVTNLRVTLPKNIGSNIPLGTFYCSENYIPCVLRFSVSLLYTSHSSQSHSMNLTNPVKVKLKLKLVLLDNL